MREVAAILLAAGPSRRIGQRNKLLLLIDDKPMVRRVAETHLAVIDTPLTVATGYQADDAPAALAGMLIKFAHNADFAEGQRGSVPAGLECAPGADPLLIGLADQPQSTSKDLSQLITAHRAGRSEKITIPMQDGRRGNPIDIPRCLRPRLTKNPERPGCIGFTPDHPDHVQTVPLNAPGFYAVVDTPDDHATLTNTEKEHAI